MLQWLDQAGLALSFFDSVQASEATACLPAEWRDALDLRMQRNAARLKDMLQEFQRLNKAFRSRGVLAVTLKGFSLVPDFCENPSLRHQTDFDFLVDSAHVEPAAEILHSFGYSTPRLSQSEESCFTTPLTHLPSHHDDLYALQHHRQVDLHVSITESSAWIKLELPMDCSQHAVPMTVCGVEFYGLSLPDRFLAQVLHAFRHSSRSWVRLSWLLEIARCMELHRENKALWSRVAERAGDGLLTKRAFALILSLANRLFQYRIPSQLHSWAAEGMTPSLRAWLDHFSVNWAVSDWPGNLSNVLLATDFIPDSSLRRRYLASRLLPTRAQLSIETMAGMRKKKSLAWHLRRWHYVLHRSTVHLKDLFRLPLLQFRWKRALVAVRPGACRLES
ncbi:MAG: nucleotidyltransferase family protein [Candidatus Acidiferrales bacterium]